MRRAVSPELAAVLDRERVVLPWSDWSTPLEIVFPSSGVELDVEHGMGAVPIGVLVLAAEGGNVQCSRVAAWTETLAFLVADAANTRARVMFVRTVEEPIDAAT